MEVEIQMGWAIHGVEQYIRSSDIKDRYWRRIQSQWTKTEALSKHGRMNGRALAGYLERKRIKTASPTKDSKLSS